MDETELDVAALSEAYQASIGPPTADTLETANEFARVRISLDRSANGERVRIQSVRTGYVSFIDPLLFEALAWADPSVLLELLKTPFGPISE